MSSSAHKPPVPSLSIAFRLRLAALLVWTVMLAYFSLVPKVETPLGLIGWDKLQHFAAYALLALLLLLTLVARDRDSDGKLAKSWLLCVGFGTLIEGLQWAMGVGRYWETGDLVANASGAFLACVIFRHFARRSSSA